jgi:hypothetical protein
LEVFDVSRGGKERIGYSRERSAEMPVGVTSYPRQSTSRIAKTHIFQGLLKAIFLHSSEDLFQVFLPIFTEDKNVVKVNENKRAGVKKIFMTCYNVWAAFFVPNGMNQNLKSPKV